MLGREHHDLAVREAAGQQIADDLRDEVGGVSYGVTRAPRPSSSFTASNSKGSTRWMNRAIDWGDR